MTQQQPGRPRLTRGTIFTVVVLLSVAVTSVYVVRVVRRSAQPRQPVATGDAAAYTLSSRPWPAAGPALLFSSLVPGDDLRNRVALVPPDRSEGPRWLTRLTCERLDFAGGRGICLGEGGGTSTLDDDVVSTHAYVFGPDLQIRHDVSLGGFPSRVRVSPDGRYGAVTVFVAGHSYADAGFSTETTLIDLESGTKIGNIESFAVTRDGRRFRSVDFNFWGVTFAPDSDRFFATLGTANKTYLVEGSVRGRSLVTRRENVECPSLSPDGTRLAFKKRMTSGLRAVWRFHVLDLATMTETPLAERRSLDDQVEWLDERQILYGDRRNVWIVPADGSGEPLKFLSQATSPAVLSSGLSAAPPDAGRTLASGNSLSLGGTDLGVAMTAAPEQASVGGRTAYRVTVTNHGPRDATGLQVDQILGDGIALVGAPTSTNPGEGYGCSVQDEERRITCDTMRLPQGQTWTITLTVRATAPGTFTTHVLVSAAEPDPRAGNDRAELRTTVR